MQIGVKLSAKFEQCLQTRFDEKIRRGRIEEAPQQLNDDEGKTEKSNNSADVGYR